jgi:hypothetical protein
MARRPGAGNTFFMGAADGQPSVFSMEHDETSNLGFLTIADQQASIRMGNQAVAYLFGGPTPKMAFGAQDSSSGRWSFQGSAQSMPAVAVKADPNQADSLVAALDSNGAKLSHIDEDGYVMTRKTAAPADSALTAGEAAWWLDDTVGATKVMFKAKDSAGNVRTAAVPLS